MKIEKNKIVFALIILSTILFLVSYSFIVFGDDDSADLDSGQLPLPELEQKQKEYETKLEALDDIEEERQVEAPSVYPEHMIDDKGYFNPDYMEYEKQRIIDSIYDGGTLDYEEQRYTHIGESPEPIPEQKRDTVDEIDQKDSEVAAKERALEHQLFFASHPIKDNAKNAGHTDAFVQVRIDGTQIARQNYRINLRLSQEATINGKHYPRNTPLFGFVRFQPHRALLEIANIGHDPVQLTAHDLKDGAEGIYVVNTFRATATDEVMGDLVDDINIAGMPDFSGIANTGAKGLKKIFRQNQQNVKVTLLNDYCLVLKPSKPSPSQTFGKPIDIEKTLKEHL